MNKLVVTKGDLLEFDIRLLDRCGHPRPMYEDEQMFFLTDPDEAGRKIDITQDSAHFRVPAVEMAPGQYPFRAGIIFFNGERRTVFKSEDSLLIVLEV